MSALSAPPDLQILASSDQAPPGQIHPYSMANFVQLGPGQAGLLAHLRGGAVEAIDFEIGNDMFLFKDPSEISKAHPVPLNRGTQIKTPTPLSTVWSVYPCKGGFIPLGARSDNGQPHPGAGTGFGVSTVVGYDPDLREKPKKGDTPSGVLVQQFRFDEDRFEIVSSVFLAENSWIEGFAGRGGLKQGISDGDDLLFPVTGHRAEEPGERIFVSRWSWGPSGWRPAELYDVADSDDFFEPSLLRNGPQSWLLTARARGGTPSSKSILVWQSKDGARTWQRILNVPAVRNTTPVSIGITPSGRVFILGNLMEAPERGGTRERLALWFLDLKRIAVLDPLLIRNCTADFGLLDGKYPWWADHPISECLVLGDGRRHCLISYRLAQSREISGGLPPTPMTGTYLLDFETASPSATPDPGTTWPDPS